MIIIIISYQKPYNCMQILLGGNTWQIKSLVLNKITCYLTVCLTNANIK